MQILHNNVIPCTGNLNFLSILSVFPFRPFRWAKKQGALSDSDKVRDKVSYKVHYNIYMVKYV